MSKVLRLNDHKRTGGRIWFDRSELQKLLAVYSQRVSRGQWRDYAIDHRPEMAAFAVFRSAYDWPLFVIAKYAPGSQRQGEFAVFQGPRRLAQGRSLDEVLGILDRQLEPVV
jgi:hypothetical protein